MSLDTLRGKTIDTVTLHDSTWVTRLTARRHNMQQFSSLNTWLVDQPHVITTLIIQLYPSHLFQMCIASFQYNHFYSVYGVSRKLPSSCSECTVISILLHIFISFCLTVAETELWAHLSLVYNSVARKWFSTRCTCLPGHAMLSFLVPLLL